MLLHCCLRINGDLSGLCSVTLESADDQEEIQPSEDEDPYNAHLSRTFVPTVAHRVTEQDSVLSLIKYCADTDGNCYNFNCACARPTMLPIITLSNEYIEVRTPILNHDTYRTLQSSRSLNKVALLSLCAVVLNPELCLLLDFPRWRNLLRS